MARPKGASTSIRARYRDLDRMCIDWLPLNEDGCLFSRAFNIDTCDECPFSDCIWEENRQKRAREWLKQGRSLREIVFHYVNLDGVSVRGLNRSG